MSHSELLPVFAIYKSAMPERTATLLVIQTSSWGDRSTRRRHGIRRQSAVTWPKTFVPDKERPSFELFARQNETVLAGAVERQLLCMRLTIARCSRGARTAARIWRRCLCRRCSCEAATARAQHERLLYPAQQLQKCAPFDRFERRQSCAAYLLGAGHGLRQNLIAVWGQRY